MTKYAAFLRGVNVGGVNLKMAEVAAALTDAGFANVRTVLATGNVLLESRSGVATVRKKAEAALRERLKTELSAYKIPKRFVALAPAEVPLLSSGKVDMQRLRKLFDD